MVSAVRLDQILSTPVNSTLNSLWLLRIVIISSITIIIIVFKRVAWIVSYPWIKSFNGFPTTRIKSEILSSLKSYLFSFVCVLLPTCFSYSLHRLFGENFSFSYTSCFFRLLCLCSCFFSN